MPTLIRFVVLLAFIAALIYGSMIALTIFVEPNQREMSERIPARDLFEQP
ncbi:MAG: histidine kinase [Cucumibacter sp.]